MLAKRCSNWSPHTLLVQIWNGSATLKNRQFYKMLNTELPYHPAISLCSICGRELKTCSYKNFVRVFIASLFIIPTKWKLYKCLLTAKWLKKNWYIHTIEYYSTIKSTELLRHSCKWTLKSIMLKERN